MGHILRHGWVNWLCPPTRCITLPPSPLLCRHASLLAGKLCHRASELYSYYYISKSIMKSVCVHGKQWAQAMCMCRQNKIHNHKPGLSCKTTILSVARDAEQPRSWQTSTTTHLQLLATFLELDSSCWVTASLSGWMVPKSSGRHPDSFKTGLGYAQSVQTDLKQVGQLQSQLDS